jgi:23S rRNA pseudouridine1911/1915/1917 synthase
VSPGDPAPQAFAVPARCAGERLDRFLADRVGSRAAAQRLIEAGRVHVDGAARPKRHRLAEGQEVTVAADPGGGPEPSPGGPAAPFEVVHEDDSLLVVDKPPGVVVHPGPGHAEGTLAQALRGRTAGGDPWRAGLVHRLDRGTSGLLVVARTQEAHRRLRRMIDARAIEREYLALVEGRPGARTATIDAPLGRDRRVRTRISVDTDAPREARTHFVLERALPAATLLRVRLETGRTHQIRAHLAAIGHPVAGDPEYGRAGLYGLERQFLHACRLAFDHPVTGVRVEAASELPGDLRRALARAERP